MKKLMDRKNKIIDLSFELHDEMMIYPSNSQVAFNSNIISNIDEDGRETRKFTMGSHCGTHIDAPKHFIKKGNSVEEYDLNDLVGKALLIDLGNLSPNSIIKLNDFKNQLDQANIDFQVRRVVFRSYWSKYWGTDQYFNGWPYFDRESIKYLIQSKVKLIGLDFPSPDCKFGSANCDEDSPNHKLIFNADIILTEYLTNLDKLNSGIIHLSVLPLKLVGFDGSPARVIAYNI